MRSLTPFVLLVPLLALPAAFSPTKAAAEDPAKPKLRVLLTYGGHDFEKKPFFAMFDALPGIVYTKAEMPKAAELLKPGLEKKFDVIVMYDMVPAIKPKQQKAFVELLNKGIGLVSLHHNLGANRDWDEFPKIIGGTFLHKARKIDGKTFGPSGWKEGEDIKITVADPKHPIMAGIEDFQIHDEVYNHRYLAPDSKVLLKTDHPKSDPAMAWVHEYGKSRVFYLMLGHDSKAWRNPNYPKIVANGIRWTATRP